MGVETTGYSGILCVGPRRGQLATVGRDGCARGREWQQLGQQQQQGRDSIRCVECYVDTATVLRHPPVGQVVARPQMPSALLVFFCSQVSNLMNFLNGQFFHTNVQILHLGRYKGHFRFAVASIVVVVVVTLLLLLGGQYSL